MIGKIIIGKSFNGCLKYCLNDKIQTPGEEIIMKDRAEIILFNKCFGNERELIQQFNEVRQLNPKLSKPVLHVSLSLAPGEQLAKDKLMEISEECARALGFEKNQFVAVLHRDTAHLHLHIIANRVGFDGRTVSDSRNYQKIARFCREMELKHGLQQVLNPRSFLSKGERGQLRQDVRKEGLRKDIQGALAGARNFEEFEQKMKSLGYQVLKGRGISFIDPKKVKIKGSEVGFSFAKIEKIFALKAQLETGLSAEAITRTRSAGIKGKFGEYERNAEAGKISGKQRQETQREKIKALLFPNGPKRVQQSLANSLEMQVVDGLKEQINDLIYVLMKPEYSPNAPNPEWLKKKRKKKKRRSL